MAMAVNYKQIVETVTYFFAPMATPPRAPL